MFHGLSVRKQFSAGFVDLDSRRIAGTSSVRLWSVACRGLTSRVFDLLRMCSVQCEFPMRTTSQPLASTNVQFSTVHSGPLSPAYFAREPRFAEAVRLMEYDLKMKDTDAAPSDGDDPVFPTIHFEGVRRGAHSSVGRVEGTVRMLAHGVVRWNFVSHARSFSVNTGRDFDHRSTRSLRMTVARTLGGECGPFSSQLHK